MKHALWITHVTICLIWILPTFHLNYKTHQDTSIVESIEPESVPDFEHLLQLASTGVSSQDTSSIEIEFVSDPVEPLESNKSSPTDVFSVKHDYDLSLLNKRLILHLTISTIRTLMSLKSKIKMISLFMPPTFATTLHYPNSWHDTTVKI